MLRLTAKVLEQIRQTVGTLPPECGGVLGAGADGVVTEFFFDATGKSTPNGYAPDVAAINRVLAEDWMPRGVLMVGIVHSHAGMIDVPSCVDVNYGMRILAALDTVDRFYLPIVTAENGEFCMTGHVIGQDSAGRFVCRREDWSISPGAAERYCQRKSKPGTGKPYGR